MQVFDLYLMILFTFVNTISIVLRICHLAQATKSEVNDLLKCGDRSVNEEVKFIVDMVFQNPSKIIFSYTYI